MARNRLTLTFVVAGMASGCVIPTAEVPPLAGPSDLGVSLLLAASPDVLVGDGISRSRLSVTAHDAARHPIAGLAVSVELSGDDMATDSGRLSHRTVTTDGRGEAGFLYTAPHLNGGPAAESRVVSVIVTPIGSNFANEVPRSVLIRLVPPSAIP